MTLLEEFDSVVDRMATALNDSGMNRARIAADALRKAQSEIHSCAKDQRMASVNAEPQDSEQ